VEFAVLYPFVLVQLLFNSATVVMLSLSWAFDLTWTGANATSTAPFTCEEETEATAIAPFRFEPE
jgi:hypothetical protein